MEGLIMLAQLLLAVLIIAGLHEFGHMSAAWLFGIRVEQFSIGFPPRIFSKTWKGTTYALGSIPLGGYVKLAGMLDESMDTKQLQEPFKPYEFRSKPAWQRLIVMLAGIFVNFLTSILIFSWIAYSQGERRISAEIVQKHGIEVGDLGKNLGLRTGDKVVSLNGSPYRYFDELIDSEVLLSEGSYYEVMREEGKVRMEIPNNFVEELSTASDPRSFISVRMPFRVEKVIPASGAEAGGVQVGDQILSLEGHPIRYLDELHMLTAVHADQSVELEVLRTAPNAGQPEIHKLSCILQGSTLGILSSSTLPYVEENYSFFEGLLVGSEQVFSLVWQNALGISKILKGDISPRKSLAGPIGIAKMFGGTWQWGRFWYLLALISVFVAFFNLLPIPALDGGHAVFCCYEIITRRQMPFKVLRYAQSIGMALLLLLMAFVLFNDIWKLL